MPDKELLAGAVMLRKVARGKVGAGAAVRLGGVPEALREERAVLLYLVNGHSLTDDASWNRKLSLSSREAYTLPSERRLTDRHSPCSFSHCGVGSQ